MKRVMPKIGIVITPYGVDSVSIITPGSFGREESYKFIASLEDELTTFESSIKGKFEKIEQKEVANES